ncbi:endoglucanase 10 [Phtheirospermum japonicum]|uniref:Endoglucanase 10 n=1 Tax=Phtheirospermum japonicum TaxID=374723 RepID=A0A830C9B0_9LAMI|nr:endoglucanase 10 [Phtheirospermum japonicum]
MSLDATFNTIPPLDLTAAKRARQTKVFPVPHIHKQTLLQKGDLTTFIGYRSPTITLTNVILPQNHRRQLTTPAPAPPSTRTRAILVYGDQMNAANQLDPAPNYLMWITDYLINAHPTDNVLYIQARGHNWSTAPNTDSPSQFSEIFGFDIFGPFQEKLNRRASSIILPFFPFESVESKNEGKKGFHKQ